MNNYQVLARKYRPRNFKEVVGQEHILKALENSLELGRLHHAYLFSGTRGVGKTSIARLFAKALNCEIGIAQEPCGKCQNCLDIEKGSFIDLIEIDAASRTKVEDTRELLDNVQYKPSVGRFKVYLIDEVHMLSRHSFNALLKTLEEPPEYVKFLLATTDPQKLPVTILSRCMQFHLRALDERLIGEHLKNVLEQEHISFDDSSINLIAKKARGSIRDSLSLTDQAIALTSANINIQATMQMLGVLDDSHSLSLLETIYLGNGEMAMDIIEKVNSQAVDWNEFLDAVIEQLHQISLKQLLRSLADDKQSQLAQKIDPQDLQLWYQMMLDAKRDNQFAPNPRMGVEMAVLRSLAFHPKKLAQSPKLENNISKTVTDTESTQKLSAREAVLSQQKSASETKEVTVKKKDSIALSQDSVTFKALNALNALQSSSIEKKKQSNISSADVKVVTEQTQKPLQQNIKVQENSFDNFDNIPVQDNFVPEIEDYGYVTQNQSSNYQNNIQQQELNDNEEYQWQWLDPVLKEQEANSQKSSAIIDRISGDANIQLRDTILKEASKQDKLSALIEQFNLISVARQIAINAQIKEDNGNTMVLSVDPSAHCFIDNGQDKDLKNIFKQNGITLQLELAQTSLEKIPTHIYQQIFAQLTQKAKEYLNQDPTLTQLIKKFNGTIDELSVRSIEI